MNGKSGFRERLDRYRWYLHNESDLYEPLCRCLLEGCAREPQEELFLHVFAPTITAFMEWVISAADKRGIKRLYFLARDGWLWMRAAECVLGKQHGNDICLENGASDTEIELRYLYVSRKTLYAGTEELQSYLRQEGMFEDVPCGIVDSGWIGTTKDHLEKLVGRTIEGFYFGMYELPRGADPKSYHCFYLRPYRDIGRKTRFSICLFEAVCSSPEGMTIGYERIGDQILPVSGEENPNGAWMKRFASILERYLYHYGRRIYASNAGHSSRQGKDLNMGFPQNSVSGKSVTAMRGRFAGNSMKRMRSLKHVLSLLMGDPTEKEAETMGSLLFDEGVEGDRLRTLAERWDANDLKKHRLFRRVRFRLRGREAVRESGWQEGSIVLSTVENEKKRALRDERNYQRARQLAKSIRRMG